MKLTEALTLINNLKAGMRAKDLVSAHQVANRLHAMVLADLRSQNERKQKQRAKEARERKAE